MSAEWLATVPVYWSESKCFAFDWFLRGHEANEATVWTEEDYLRVRDKFDERWNAGE